MDLAMRTCSFRDVELRRLSRSHVEAWVKEMASRGLAPGTIKTRVNNVRGVIRAAVRDRRMPEDPSIGVTLPRLRKAEASMRVPTPEEVGVIMAGAEWWFRPFVAVCAFAGLRLGEAAALQADDINFLRRQIHVRRQVQRHSANEIALSPPKYGSERVIFAADELLAILSQHFADHGTFGTDRWLFMGQYGLPPHQNTVGYWWRKTLAAAGVDGIRLHDLRHFYASGADRLGLRCRHRPACARARPRDHHPQHLQPSLAHRRGPHSRRRGRARRGRTAICGIDRRRRTGHPLATRRSPNEPPKWGRF